MGMMAVAPPSATGEVACPDPSMHNKHDSLQSSASKAALYGNYSEKRSRYINPLGPDGKLSAAGAAASLKYAKPHELPSFPSVGVDTSSSGHSAANLANSSQQHLEQSKPQYSASAGKAALLAQRDGGRVDLWYPTASAEGLGAAGIAMSKQHNLSPQLDYGYTDEGSKKALLAATKSVSAKPRSESSSIPPRLYPDAENSAYNALNAATVAHKPSTRAIKDSGRWGSDAMEAARVKNLGPNVSREMFTEHPPIGPGLAEKTRENALHASAVSMAKQMYDPNSTYQQPGEAKYLASSYINLQAAAQKLAAERLAKLDPDGVLAYREHYGYTMNGPSVGPRSAPPRAKLSTRLRINKGTPDDQEADFSDDDEAQAGKIRQQMSNFNDKLASVDAQKRDTDRQNLMATAEKRVQARLQALDDKVFMETGKVSPAMMVEWEAKARAKAAADSEQRMQTHGKVHIGGGKFMDQSEITAIAAARMQPTLDEITDTAEKQRAHDDEVRHDQELRRRQMEDVKQRGKANKAEAKRIKNEEKAQARYERDAAKTQERREKEAEKLRMIEEKRQLAEEKRVQYEADRQQRQEVEMRDAAIKQEAARDRAEQAEREAEDAAAEPTGFVTARTSEELLRSPEVEPVFTETAEPDHAAEGLYAPSAIVTVGPGEIAAGTVTGPGHDEVADILDGSFIGSPIDGMTMLTIEEGPTTQVGHQAPARDNDIVINNVGSAVPTELPANEGGSAKVVEIPFRSTEKAAVAQSSTQRDPLRRESRAKGFFGKFRRSSQIQPKTNATVSRTGRVTAASDGTTPVAGASPFTSSGTGAGLIQSRDRVDNNGGLYSEPSNEGVGPKDKERQSTSDVSAVSNEVGLKRGRTGRSDDSSEEFEEARDKFDDDKLAAADTGFTSHSKEDQSLARANSKFQEKL